MSESGRSLGYVLWTNTPWTGNKGLFLIKVPQGEGNSPSIVTLLSGLPGLPVRGKEGWRILQDVFKLGDYRYSGLPAAVTVYTCWFGVIANMVVGGLVTKFWLFCDLMDYSPPDSSVHEISQAKILDWVTISFSGDLPDPGIEPSSPALLYSEQK